MVQAVEKYKEKLVKRHVITWFNPATQTLFFFHLGDHGQIGWTTRQDEARIFRSKGETGPALTWLRQFVRPKVEDVKVKESIPVAKAHPGFKAVQNRIARKQGVSPARAGAMLAAGTRRASAGAKKANPRLKRVKG